jgi:hypothetical protein
MKDTSLAVFEGKQIRRYYDENTETWYFSVVDIIQVLIQQPDYQTARKYWNKLKERLKKEGSEWVTKCHRLKMAAADGKKYLWITRSGARYTLSGHRRASTISASSQNTLL